MNKKKNAVSKKAVPKIKQERIKENGETKIKTTYENGDVVIRGL